MSVYNNATNTPRLTAAGQIFIGRSSGNPIANTLTAGPNILITNTDGNIQIASTGGSLLINQVGLQFLTPGTFSYNPTAGTIYAFVQVLGGAGAGGGATNSGTVDVCVGSGGGGGGYTEAFISISDIGAGQIVTVGSGGIGISSDDGGDGTGSSFGSFLIANPGLGGILGEAQEQFANGGSGGGYSGSSLLYGYAGQTGGSSGPGSGTITGEIPPYSYSGYGGSSFTGRTNEGNLWSTLSGSASVPGSDETEYGCGGSGGLSAISSAPAKGGDGAGGFVLITEYITASGTAPFTWVYVTTGTQIMVPNTGYINNQSLSGTTLFSLPSTSNLGDILEIGEFQGSDGWMITQGDEQQIFYGADVTSLGVSGSLSSTNAGDTVRLVCVNANTVWEVLSSVGNLTVA